MQILKENPFGGAPSREQALLRGQAPLKGQGAIEYLLLLAAAVAVTAVVISYMIFVLQIGGDQLNQQTLDNKCKGVVDSNSLVCGCFLKDSTKGEINSYGITIMASALTCPEKLEEKYQNNPLLVWN